LNSGPCLSPRQTRLVLALRPENGDFFCAALVFRRDQKVPSAVFPRLSIQPPDYRLTQAVWGSDCPAETPLGLDTERVAELDDVWGELSTTVLFDGRPRGLRIEPGMAVRQGSFVFPVISGDWSLLQVCREE
jgi:hypothetical protein